jgi:hypothetical protein
VLLMLRTKEEQAGSSSASTNINVNELIKDLISGHQDSNHSTNHLIAHRLDSTNSTPRSGHAILSSPSEGRDSKLAKEFVGTSALLGVASAKLESAKEDKCRLLWTDDKLVGRCFG